MFFKGIGYWQNKKTWVDWMAMNGINLPLLRAGRRYSKLQFFCPPPTEGRANVTPRHFACNHASKTNCIIMMV